MIQSNYGNVFGGFTTTDWGGNSCFKKDDLAFLYLVKSKFDHPPKIYNNKVKDDKAIRVSPSLGPTWGNAFDLSIQNDGVKPYSALGWNDRYEGKGNELCGGDVHRAHASVYSFELIDYEVFVVECVVNGRFKLW